MFAKLLIANRGEIACRIARTARAMGIGTVAVHSEADRDGPHVRAADEAVAIGPAPAAESYLRGEAIIAAARATGAGAIHPGYGFLAENAGFAEAVAAAGLVFVGPPADAIRAMGAKDAAKRRMEAAGVPIVPGHHGEDQDPDRLRAAAGEIGFPVLIKAALGGGGKGMRRVDDAADFPDALAAARREAEAAFGDGRVIVERYVASPRHIEVQVFADGHGGIVHLYERDCTLQRRHQKVIEEAPAPGMTAGLRAAMTDAAVAAARAVGYVGAGTVEFIVDGTAPLCDETPFFFMEMNTRLQVEHPVTEMVTGLDLVEWQLRIAAGETLPLGQADIPLLGHAAEARLYAESPATGFLPSTGPVLRYRVPGGAGLRVESGVAEGGEIGGHYDPMIAKVIAHGGSRDEALDRLDGALARLEFAGPETNQAFLRLLLAEPAFREGRMDTGLIDRRLPELVAALADMPEELAAAAMLGAVRQAAEAAMPAAPGPWAAADGFQNGPPRLETRDLVVGGKARTVTVEWRDGVPTLADAPPPAAAALIASGGETIAVGGGRQLRARLADPFDFATEGEGGDGDLRAPMPGLVARVETEAGAAVARGQILMVLEAMKMEHAVRAPFDGIVARIDAAAGDRVGQGDRLATVEAAE